MRSAYINAVSGHTLTRLTRESKNCSASAPTSNGRSYQGPLNPHAGCRDSLRWAGIRLVFIVLWFTSLRFGFNLMLTRERFLSNIGQIVKKYCAALGLKPNNPKLQDFNAPFRSSCSKESSDPCGQSHGQRTPQRDAHCAHRYACTAHARRQATQKREEHQ